MTDLSFAGRDLVVDGTTFRLDYPILDAFALGPRVVVLFDPDSYLLDPDYLPARQRGAPAIRNLIGLALDGTKLWEADFPEATDYYYQVVTRVPLVVYSFSSYRCQIDPRTGRIESKIFLK